MSQTNRRSGSQRRKSSQNYSQEENIDSEEAVNDVVRYLVIRGNQNTKFTKQELTRLIHMSGESLDDLLKQVSSILEEVYGYQIKACNSENRREKAYFVTNVLPYVQDPTEENDSQGPAEDINDLLLLLILSHILMSNNKVSEGSLYSFLNQFDIDPDVRHSQFGLVRDYISKVLVKKQYLAIVDKDNFKWGPKAEAEISKLAALEFVCKIYGNRQPKDWKEQYEAALEQSPQSAT